MNKYTLLTVLLVFYVNTTFGCEDIENQVCSQLIQKYPGFCSDTCLSTLCQRSCGLCPTSCYECHEVDNPKNCTNVVECPSKDHYCFTTQSFADDFREIYKLGCATKNLCAGYFGDNVKRSLKVDAACCHEDRCNNLTPEAIEYVKHNHQMITAPPSNETTISPLINDCRNIDDSICTRIIQLNPDFCQNDTCAASKLCPLMCKSCFRCNSCNDIEHIDDCKATTACKGGKKCYSLETLSFDLRPVYRLGCMDDQLCQRFMISSPQIFGKRQQLQLKGGCCNYDLCNDNDGMTTTPATTTTTQVPTTVITGCGHHSSRHCPSGFQLYHSCYHVGKEAKNWHDAESYCKSKCTRLADFSSLRDLQHVFSHVLSEKSNSTTLDFWTDGVGHTSAFKSGGHYWMWSTTKQRISSELTHHVHLISFNDCLMLKGNSHTSTDLLSAANCQTKLTPVCKL
ncbi:uncharacterized protein LOC143047793 [Mytilus galloprovincialis]|uniref:uncharacterized protein LOC143047793 n=1 Tax=Mytilus galloprovincialis TaxID=29158 RepID=UPI003F7CD32A